MNKLILFSACLFFLTSCVKEKEPAAEPVAVFDGFKKPEHFPEPLYKFQNNEVTEDGFALGKKLFYDGRLSRDGSISCASCHLQFSAFSHFDHDVSHGIDDRLGTRNSPAIQNMAWAKFMMWDGGVFDLDLFPFAPITNPVEMDETVENVLVKLKADPAYLPLFKKAFGTDSITGIGMMKALSQFMCMLVSDDSKYDRYVKGDASAMNITEIEGMNLFMNNCNRCHTAPLFTDNKFHNNGIRRLVDKGRFEITQLPEDTYKFKTPSLRNVDKTMPYMHDGRMKTLEEILAHYHSNIPSGNNVDEGLIGGMSLSPEEQGKIIAFLKALTDDKFLRNPKFSEE